jgi:ATP-binding protein involved in chromosome partitioning
VGSKRAAFRIAVFSGKGGVGKTTVAVNLACAFGRRGRAVGLLDADITGPNVLQMMGVDGPAQGLGDRLLPHERHAVKVVSLASLLPADAAVIWRGPLRSKALEQLLNDSDWGDLDVLIIDLPPGTGDEALTVAQQMGPQLAIVVTTPQEVALLDARRAVDFASKLEIPQVAILENMSGLVCPHCGGEVALFGSGGGEREAERQGLPFLGKIPIDPVSREEADAGTPTVLARPDSTVAQAFDRAVDRILEMLGMESESGGS